MKAAESRFFGRKRHGHAGNSAAAHIALRADLPGFICRLLAHLRPVLRVMTLAVVMAGLASAPLPGEFASAAAYGGAHAALAEQLSERCQAHQLLWRRKFRGMHFPGFTSKKKNKITDFHVFSS